MLENLKKSLKILVNPRKPYKFFIFSLATIIYNLNKK